MGYKEGLPISPGIQIVINNRSQINQSIREANEGIMGGEELDKPIQAVRYSLRNRLPSYHDAVLQADVILDYKAMPNRGVRNMKSLQLRFAEKYAEEHPGTFAEDLDLPSQDTVRITTPSGTKFSIGTLNTVYTPPGSDFYLMRVSSHLKDTDLLPDEKIASWLSEFVDVSGSFISDTYDLNALPIPNRTIILDKPRQIVDADPQ